MPNDFYTTDLSSLYTIVGTDTTDSVYKVEEIVDKYTTQAGIVEKISFSDYVGAISSVSLKYESSSDVDTVNVDAQGYKPRLFAGTSVADSCAPVLPAGCSKAPSLSSVETKTTTTTIPSGNPSFSNIETQDINVSIVSTTGDAASSAKIMAELGKRIAVFNDVLKMKKGTTTVNVGNVGTHEEFNEYTMNIIVTIGSYYFQNVFEMIALTETTNVQKSTNPATEKANRIRVTAMANMKTIQVPWRFEPLMQALRKSCMQSIQWMMTKDTSMQLTDFIKAFKNRAAMSPATSADQPTKAIAKFYYRLRSTMLDFFNLDKNITSEDDREIRLFMKKLIVDLYIKTCYPVIHFDMLDALQQKYIKAGDFINSRLCLVAKCVLTFYLVTEVDKIGNSTSTSETASTIQDNIVKYLARNSKADVMSSSQTSDQMTSILKDLHKISDSVEMNSDKSVSLQKAISENQLTMRSVMLATEARKKEISMKQVEFWIIFSILITTIAACGALFFFDKVDIALMVASGVLVITLVFLLVMMIANFIKKN
jgi:hypothetical protein